jgi:hypothetical protein
MELDPSQHSPDLFPPAPPPRPQFSEELRLLARGTVDDEATMGLSELVEAVRVLGKKGTMTVELTVEPAGSGGRTVTIAGKVAVKAPKPDPELSIRFVGDAGTLHLDDPYARRLAGVPFVDTEGTPKVIDPGTEEPRRLTDAEVDRLPRPMADAPAPAPTNPEDTTA